MSESTPCSASQDKNADADAEYVTLRELARSREPLGAWRIHAALEASGLHTSEATVGRLLRRLDLAGYTERIGAQGRILTAKGEQRILEVEQARQRTTYHDLLSTAVSSGTREALLDLLRARRLIEAETARLAALQATEQEIAEIERAVEVHIQVTHAGQDSVANNHRIHNLIADASHSAIFQAIVKLFNQDEHLHETQYQIQASTGGVNPEVHRPIAAAIRRRDPEGAAAAMQHHIDLLIRGCQASSEQVQVKHKRETHHRPTP